jgi:hypothetical protein
MKLNLLLSATLLSTVASAKPTFVSLQCARPGSDGATTLAAPVFLTADTDDVRTTPEGVQLSGRQPVLARQMRANLTQCRNTYRGIIDVNPYTAEATWGPIKRKWNVMVVRPAPGSQTYLCGVGTVVSYFDTKAGWLEAWYQANEGPDQSETISDRACFIDETGVAPGPFLTSRS